jgi:hypothetical protein
VPGTRLFSIVFGRKKKKGAICDNNQDNDFHSTSQHILTLKNAPKNAQNRSLKKEKRKFDLRVRVRFSFLVIFFFFFYFLFFFLTKTTLW